MLTISNFSKSYNGIPVITLKEMKLSPGVYWIKGENGSGKTSFFKSLAGILPFEGSIAFDDAINLTQNPIQFRMRVNYSDAEPTYPAFLTARDLIHFVGQAKGSTPDQKNFLTKHFGIEAYYTRACGTYSSGILKKLSLAVAFLGNPKVIILDEPLITLDQQARAELFELIEQLVSKVIFLFSSHQPIETDKISIVDRYKIFNKEIIRD